MARVIKELLPEKEHVKLGYPSKFSSLDKRRIISSITIGKTDNAVQATSIFAQTACNVLKATSLKAMVKKKNPLLSVKHRKRRLDFALKYKDWTMED